MKEERDGWRQFVEWVEQSKLCAPPQRTKWEDFLYGMSQDFI